MGGNGNGHIHAKRNCFPLAAAAEFTFNNDVTPLDQLTVKKLTCLSPLISKRGPARHPPVLKNVYETLTPFLEEAPPLTGQANSSVFTSAFLSLQRLQDFHYKHINHRAIYVPL
jgi:hypothetical protein